MNLYTSCSIIEGFSGLEHSAEEVIQAWAYLIKTGVCWRLQGSYGRTAQQLIEAEIISDCGDVL
jgi:hypothetical protein